MLVTPRAKYFRARDEAHDGLPCTCAAWHSLLAPLTLLQFDTGTPAHCNSLLLGRSTSRWGFFFVREGPSYCDAEDSDAGVISSRAARQRQDAVSASAQGVRVHLALFLLHPPLTPHRPTSACPVSASPFLASRAPTPLHSGRDKTTERRQEQVDPNEDPPHCTARAMLQQS